MIAKICVLAYGCWVALFSDYMSKNKMHGCVRAKMNFCIIRIMLGAKTHFAEKV